MRRGRQRQCRQAWSSPGAFRAAWRPRYPRRAFKAQRRVKKCQGCCGRELGRRAGSRHRVNRPSELPPTERTGPAQAVSTRRAVRSEVRPIQQVWQPPPPRKGPEEQNSLRAAAVLLPYRMKQQHSNRKRYRQGLRRRPRKISRAGRRHQAWPRRRGSQSMRVIRGGLRGQGKAMRRRTPKSPDPVRRQQGSARLRRACRSRELPGTRIPEQAHRQAPAGKCPWAGRTPSPRNCPPTAVRVRQLKVVPGRGRRRISPPLVSLNRGRVRAGHRHADSGRPMRNERKARKAQTATLGSQPT